MKLPVVKKTLPKCLKTIYVGSIVIVRHYMCSSSIKQTYAQEEKLRHPGERLDGVLLAPLLFERFMCEGNN